MHILITGGTGFIGSRLCGYFLKKSYRVTVITRNIHQKRSLSDQVNLIEDFNALENPVDVIINLAGESLYRKRWNADFKKILLESRVQMTERVVNYIRASSSKPKLFMSGSAVGFYGNSLETLFTEASEPEQPGFASELCQQWESTAKQAENYGVRVCLSRTGIVLEKNGGALKQMLLPAKLGLGAILGDGRQWFSWIHMEDMIRAMDFLIENESLSGPFNLCAPNPVTNEALTKTLAKVLHRPAFLKFPPSLVRALFGEMGDSLLLAGQRVKPQKLLEAGFVFRYPALEDALITLT